MAKLLRLKDKILLGLAFAGDVFDEVRTAGGTVGSAYKQMYGFVPEKYRKNNLYVSTHRMLKADLIEKVVEEGNPKFRITSNGKKTLVRDFPLISLQNKKWDKCWRVVIFDIPEDRKGARNSLRSKLVELGFGCLQRSVWISPHPLEDDIREFLTTNKLNRFVYVFVSGEELTGNIYDLVDDVWDLEKLNSDYEVLVLEIEEGNSKNFMSDYLDIVMEDPFLPKELLPDPWWGDKARQAVRGMMKKLE